MNLLLALWFGVNLGFVLGCVWACRKYRVREVRS